jgi:hypothetical protein
MALVHLLRAGGYDHVPLGKLRDVDHRQVFRLGLTVCRCHRARKTPRTEDCEKNPTVSSRHILAPLLKQFPALPVVGIEPEFSRQVSGIFSIF